MTDGSPATAGTAYRDYPESDVLCRTPREQGRPVGATRCGCLLTTWTEITGIGTRRCKGCGAKVSHTENVMRMRARDQAARCEALRRRV